MPASAAVKKENSSKKLSTGWVAIPGFDRERLATELLSLGHKQITPPLARTLSREVEEELRRRPATQVSAELISQLVQFKLEEMGLIEVRKTSSRFNLRSVNPSLPTLEKFIRNSAEETMEHAVPPPPPKAAVRLSPRALDWVRENLFPSQDLEAARQAYEVALDQIAQQAAATEAEGPHQRPISTLAVEFFNCMANQEFFPHLAPLLAAGDHWANGAAHCWLPLSSRAWEGRMEEALALWKQGKSVGFLLEENCAGGWSTEAFQQILEAIEQRLLDLPESVEMPRAVLFQLAPTHPYAQEFLNLAHSGKFYVPFHFQWVVPAGLEPNDPLLETIWKESWKKSEPRLVFLGSQSVGLSGPGPDGGMVLNPYEVCSLGSLNLSILAAGPEVDWGKLRRMVRTALHFLENLLPATPAVLPPTQELMRHQRKVGLGVMGFADLLVKLGLPYDSEAAVQLAEKLMRFIAQEAQQAAQNRLAPEATNPSSLSAHTAVLSVGSVAALAEVTPGVAPLSTLVQDGAVLPLIQQVAKGRNIWSEALEAEILEQGDLRNSDSAPRPLRRLLVTEPQLESQWRLRIQGAVQQYSDGLIPLNLTQGADGAAVPSLAEGVAAGIRLLKGERTYFHLIEAAPVETPVEEVMEPEAMPALEIEEIEIAPQENPEEIFEEISSALNQSAASEIAEPIETGELVVEPEEVTDPGWLAPQRRPRPEVLTAVTRQIPTACGPLTVTIGRDEIGPYELRADLGKSGSYLAAQSEAISRLTSLLLQVGVGGETIAEELKGIRCPVTAWDGEVKVLSCADGIAQVLLKDLGLTKATPEAEDEEEVTALL